MMDFCSAELEDYKKRLSNLLTSAHGNNKSKKFIKNAYKTVEAFYIFFHKLYRDRWHEIFSSMLKAPKKAALINTLNPTNDVNSIHEISKKIEWSSKLDIRCLHENVAAFPKPMLNGDQNRILSYYCMDLASLLPVLALDPMENDAVLDMCAAPGGKSLAILQYCSNISLTVNDPSKERRTRLRRVMDSYIPEGKRDKIKFWGRDGRDIGQEGDTFDKILCDVPCSGERHLLRNLKEISKWSHKLTEKNANVQYQLLKSAISCCKKGGRVVYSTCSISPLENDFVIDKVVSKTSCIKLIKLKLPIGERTKFGWLCLPDKTGHGPIFLSLLEKT